MKILGKELDWVEGMYFGFVGTVFLFLLLFRFGIFKC
jgi:hypothetical protein